MKFTAPLYLISTPEACHKFSKCSATICPLDPDWQLRVLRRDDKTCLNLTEFVKAQSRERFEVQQLEVLYQRIAEVLPAITSSLEHLEKRLQKASTTNSRWDASTLMRSDDSVHNKNDIS